MKTADDLETYMLEMGLSFDTIEEGMWVVHDDADHIDNIVIHYSPPLVIFRVKMFGLPDGNKEALFKRLLELNATEMVHGAYGIEGDAVVMIDTLEVENLDDNEFTASLEAMTLSLISHYPLLKDLARGKEAA